MPEVRRRDFGELIGAAAQRTLVGVSQGAGIATTLARLGNLPPATQTTRSSTGYSQTLTHGPGSDETHTFEFHIGPGLWAAQVSVAAVTSATSGQLTINVSGDTPPGTIGPLSLSVEGDTSTTFSVFVNGAGTGTVDVACEVEALDPAPLAFSATVIAFRIS